MLNIHTLPLGSYQTNCYILWNEGSATCAVIDPGAEPERILAETARLGLTIDAILLTHGHFDHVGAVKALWEATGCKLWMHKCEWAQDGDSVFRFYYPLANCDFTEVKFCQADKKFRAGGLTFTLMFTPGHTPGSVCYICEDAMFCGDTLFADSYGRTDLPGGDQSAMVISLLRLAGLTRDYRLFPGHGESSTLQWEQTHNPYLMRMGYFSGPQYI